MELHPLTSRKFLAEQILQNLRPFDELVLRSTGRSTVQALRLLAKCIDHPDTMHPCTDHHGTRNANHGLLRMLLGMVSSLKFLPLRVDVSGSVPMVGLFSQEPPVQLTTTPPDPIKFNPNATSFRAARVDYLQPEAKGWTEVELSFNKSDEFAKSL